MIAWRNGPRVRQVLEKDVRLDAPAIVLIDPKYPHNVGQVVRVACCFGIDNVIYSGSRVKLHDTTERLPREERMRDYADINLLNYDRPFDILHGTPIGVEIRDNTESLPSFDHPEDAIYIFGPEDGSLGRPTLQHCHRFLSIPTLHCLNLATAVSVVLYDRIAKMRENRVK